MSTSASYPNGPGYGVYNANALQFRDDWTVNNKKTFIDIVTNLQGLVGRRLKDRMAEISAAPLGFWTTAWITALYPYQPDMRGQSVFPTTDLPFVIQTTAGKSITFPKAALTDMPPASFSPTKAIFGAAKWTCLVKGGATGTAAGDFVTVANSAYSAPAITPAAILTGRYTLSFGDNPSSPMNNIAFKDSVDFTPKVTMEPITVQGVIVGYWIKEVTAEVSFEPVNLTESDLYNSLDIMDGAGADYGADAVGLGGALTVTGAATGQPVLTLPLAYCSESSLKFGTNGRVGKITCTALRKAASGVLSPLFAFSTVA